MITIITQYISRIAGTALISGAIISVAGKGASANICKLAGALLIISTVVTPIRSMKWDFDDFFKTSNDRLEYSVENAENQYRELTNSVVADKLEKYAEEEAEKKGIEVEIEISAYMDEKSVFHVKNATVTYAKREDFAHRLEVEKILTEECGIEQTSQKHVYEE